MAFYRFSMMSDVLGFPVDMRAIIPDEGDCPALWLLHGANSDCDEWLRLTSMRRYLQGRRLAVITVSVHNGFYVNMAYGAPYADFLENEWTQRVRALFPGLSRERGKNCVAGASMGGFGAFRLAVNRPELFGRAGAFAGSIEMATIVERNARGLQPGGADFGWAFGGYENMINNSNDVMFMARDCVRRGVMPKLYMVCGRDDFGYALNTIARDDLRLVGADVRWIEREGVHSYDCWDPEVPAFLDWVEGREETACC